jgi:hypothetical protein
MKVENEVVVSVASWSEFFTPFYSNMWPCMSFRAARLVFSFIFSATSIAIIPVIP